MKKVLYVEDDPELQQNFVDAMHGQAEVLVAATDVQAWQMFQANPDVAVIVFDGHLGNHDSLGVIRRIKSVYVGPMLAVSSDPQLRERQVGAGCTESMEKMLMYRRVRKLLGLIQ